MASTFSPDLRIELIGAGEQPGVWGTTTNTNLGTLIEDAIAGYVSVSVTSANQAFTANNGAYDQARNATIALTTTTTAAFAVYAPPAAKQYVIWNTTAYAATVYNSTVLGNTTAAGLGVVVAAGKKLAMFSDGTNFREVEVSAFSGVLPVVNGGTGVTTSTGTGNTVLSTSPTLVTPALGTPSALVGTNITGTAAGLSIGGNAATVTTNANLTGGVTSVGNAATVVTNANLTGDVTSIGNATTLAASGVSAGSYGSSSAIPVLTVDAKGRVTSASTSGFTAVSSITAGSGLTGGTITSTGTIALDYYTGTTQNNTSYPIGSYVAVNTSSTRVNVNASTTLWSPSSDSTVPATFAITSQGTGSGTLAGTWRSRGVTFGASSGCVTFYYSLYQRTA